MGLYNRGVDAVSFSNVLYRLQRELNFKIDMPDTIDPPRSRGAGVGKHFKIRRISIAEAYLMVVRELDSEHARARLRALKMLADASFHAKTVDMPLNTARVQMALIKEAIKSRNNNRKQLELLHDFSESSYGRHNFIRRLCNELNIIEVPETGKRLCDLQMGWDSHVHDTSSSGRKNPAQLVIDAFIKGISELTIVYSTTAVTDMMEEALEAGKTLGIKVNIGMEFSVNALGRRFHFMALLPDVRATGGARSFFKKNRRTLGTFLKGLEENQKHRLESVRRLVDNFNHTFLKGLNEGISDGLYQVPKLKMSALETFMPLPSVNRMHLGEFLFSYYRPVLARRVLSLRAQRDKASHDLKRKRISDWDFNVVERRYREVKRELDQLTPDFLLKRYFTNPALADYQTVLGDLDQLSRQLRETGCTVKVLHPLEHGLDKAKKLLESHGGCIDSVEIYNMEDSANRDPDEILRFAKFVNDINEERVHHGNRTFVPVCGSDATGRSPKIPGMGFIFERAIIGKNRREYLKKHVLLPDIVSRMISAGGAPVPLDEPRDRSAVVNMGKISESSANRRGEGPGDVPEAVPISRAIRFANPRLKSALYVVVGFLIALRYIGLDYALIWFGITALRNFIADAVSRRGLRVREWTSRSIDFNNMARSLFWSGLSVPLLGLVKQQFDLLWPFSATGVLLNFATFFFISFANGLYLALHNTLRGFDAKVVRANFFRSALSWPVASLSAPVGNLLGIPSIVQAKFWSDFVGGLIEGTGKYIRVLKLRRRDVEELIPRICSDRSDDRNGAIIELLYLFREEPRTRNSLRDSLRVRSRSDDACRKLSTVIERDGLYSELIQFVIKEQSGETARELVILIGGTFPLFQEWLAGQTPPPGAPRRSKLQTKKPAQTTVPEIPNE